MKNFFLFLAAIIVLTGLWNDLSTGSLPSAHTMASQETDNSKQPTLPADYQLVTIAAGDTVLSIVDKLAASSSEPMDITQVVNDFTRLNNGMNPEDIQIGQTYKFPVYQ